MLLKLKKVSIFVDGYLRSRLSDEDSELLAKAFGYAVVFPTVLVQLLSTGRHQQEELPEGLRPMYKFFHGVSAESHWINDAFASAVRIEAVLKVWVENIVKSEVSFYPRGAKEAPFILRIAFDSNGYIAGGINYGMTGAAKKQEKKIAQREATAPAGD